MSPVDPEIDDQAVTLERRVDPAAAPTLLAPADTPSTSSSQPSPVDAARAPLEESAGERYATRAVLGEGGMGEVRLCRDRRIGRDVAMKVVRPGVGSQSDLRARFEREARVQGQLEHPSIVPVYDLGIGADGAAFFTMKRVRGETLGDVLQSLEERDPEVEAQYGARKLLASFAQVCQAVAFAHARGVLHRDLKPANVMLGAFGEVYVLDWGLAKLFGDSAVDDLAPSRRSAELATDDTIEARAIALPAATATGTIMGTPGYMAPEQVRGEGDRLDARSDVWALGAILFEILARTPLVDRTPGTEAVLVATLQGVEARPSIRAPERDVAPELEAIVVRATALDPEDRYPTVRAMLSDLEAFLDGDRDLARRRELAEEHAARARDPGAAPAEAIREASRAIALDPSNEGALSTILELVLAVPREMPEEAEAEWEARMVQNRRANERIGAWAYLSWFIVTPIFVHMGVRSWPLFGAACGAILVAFVLAFLVGRNKLDELRGGLLAFVASLVAIGLSSLIFGPFVLVSGMAAANVVFFVLNLERGKPRRWVIGSGALTILAPLALEKLGLLGPSYAFHDGVISILPRMASFPETATFWFLLLGNLVLVTVPGLIAAHVHDAMRDAEKRAFLHHWHIRQFLPDQARGAAKMAVPEPVVPACSPRHGPRAEA